MSGCGDYPWKACDGPPAKIIQVGGAQRGEITGHLSCVEFVGDHDEDERQPGTYVTIRVDDPNMRWAAGRVVIKYASK